MTTTIPKRRTWGAVLIERLQKRIVANPADKAAKQHLAILLRNQRNNLKRKMASKAHLN